MMDAGISNVIYMELHSGPKMANGTCGKMIVAGTMDRGSTVMHYAFSALTDACPTPYNVVCNGITSNDELQLSPFQ